MGISNFNRKMHLFRSMLLYIHVQSSKYLYKTWHYSMEFDITGSCCGSQIFYHEILQKNYRKMTMKSFSYNLFKNWSLLTKLACNTVNSYGPKYSYARIQSGDRGSGPP